MLHTAIPGIPQNIDGKRRRDRSKKKYSNNIEDNIRKKKLINNLKRLRPSWVELPTKKKNDLKNKLSYCNLQHLKKYSKRGQGSKKAIGLRMMMKLFKLTLIIIKTFCGYLIKSYYYFFILF